MLPAASAGESDLAPMTLCTGRPQPYVEVLMKILTSGTRLFAKRRGVLFLVTTVPTLPAPSPRKVQGLHRLRERIVAEVLPDFPGLVYQFGKEAQMSLFSKDPACFESVAGRVGRLAASIPGLELVITPSHYYLNIDLKGVDKGAAIRTLLADLGLKKEEAAGIGDTMGDISIRDAVHFFACPANAVPGIRAVADYVSPYPDIRGVLDILERPEMRR